MCFLCQKLQCLASMTNMTRGNYYGEKKEEKKTVSMYKWAPDYCFTADLKSLP